MRLVRNQSLSVVVAGGCLSFALLSSADATVIDTVANKAAAIDELVIWGAKNTNDPANEAKPSSLLTPTDFGAINVATTEDLVKFEPSLVIRRRYIGDSNGTLGMRSANMFQTSRSMVFADGVPLHYFLQTRWNGAPRWTLVSASEIAQVEVLYGPFSAEYGGNAMGGVVNIETSIPQSREYHFNTSMFVQNFSAYGFDDTLTGYKSFVSFGDKVGDLSYYLSYNRLDNESQPQSFYFSGMGNDPFSPLATASGSIVGNDAGGVARHFFADTGVENTTTNNYKAKIGYEFGDWMALLNIAYEDRTTLRDSPNAYLSDALGNPIYSGTVLLADSNSFTIAPSRLSVSSLERDSLNLGLRVKGDLQSGIALETNVSHFAVLRDESRTSASNPADPVYTPAGEINDYDDTGWQTAAVKLTFSDLGIAGLAVSTGLRYESYQLGFSVYNSQDYAAGSKDSVRNRSGGDTAIQAAFVQADWDINSQWNLTLGGRYEAWQSENGFYSQGSGASLSYVDVPNRDETAFSPKLSVGYFPTDNWTFGYALAKAYRFPIVEELFSRYQRLNSRSDANPNLAPEHGLHHNFSASYALDNGYLRLNLFHDIIEDTIESFTDVNFNVTTFHAIGEVETTGIEFIANSYDALVEDLDVRFNLTYMTSEIVSNANRPELVGKTPPRMPEWRSNLLATYHLNDQWQIAANVQYAAKAFNTLDNSDFERNVFGAQDGYTRIGMNSDYAFANGFKIGLGIDNLTDEIAYVAHPWPGRTFYLDLNYDFD